MMFRYVSIYTAARFLGISSLELSELVRTVGIPHVDLPGGNIRFDVRDLSEWAESRKQPPRTTEIVTTV